MGWNRPLLELTTFEGVLLLITKLTLTRTTDCKLSLLIEDPVEVTSCSLKLSPSWSPVQRIEHYSV